MTDISEARQALRDLARTELTVGTSTPEEGIVIKLMPLGEVAGPLFMAVQAALTVAEELRVIRLPDGLSPDEAFGWRQCRDDAADRIEAAVLKALS